MDKPITNYWALPGLKETGKVKMIRRDYQVGEIIKVVCKFFNCEEGKIVTKCRKRPYVTYRQMVIYLSRMYTDLTLAEIGREVSVKRERPMDHTTVINSIQVIRDLMEYDDVIRSQIEALEKMLE